MVMPLRPDGPAVRCTRLASPPTDGGESGTSDPQAAAGCLHVLFSRGAPPGLLPRESCGNGGQRPATPRQPQALTATHLRHLLRATYSSQRDSALLAWLSGTGLRVGEWLALTVGELAIRERAGQVTVRQGKEASYCTVPLPLAVRQALVVSLAEAHPEPKNPAAPLWQGPRGQLRNPGAVSRIVAQDALAAGLAPVNPPARRHPFATRYRAANPGDLWGLARLLGHKRLDTVMLYTEPALPDQAARMERVAVAPLEHEA